MSAQDRPDNPVETALEQQRAATISSAPGKPEGRGSVGAGQAGPRWYDRSDRGPAKQGPACLRTRL